MTATPLPTPTPTPKPLPIIVKLTLVARGSAQFGSGLCTGTGGYSDIRDGAQVTVKDGGGNILAVDKLAPGAVTTTGDCLFISVVKDVPDATFYQIEVSHRGALTYSREDLNAKTRTTELTLGAP